LARIRSTDSSHRGVRRPSPLALRLIYHAAICRPRIAKYLSSNYSITGRSSRRVRSSSHNSAIFSPMPSIRYQPGRAGRAGPACWVVQLSLQTTHATHITHWSDRSDDGGQWSVYAQVSTACMRGVTRSIYVATHIGLKTAWE